MLALSITKSRKTNISNGSPLQVSITLLVLCSSLVAHSQAIPPKRYSARSMIYSNSTYPKTSSKKDWWLGSSYEGDSKYSDPSGTMWGNPVKPIASGAAIVARFELHRMNHSDPLRRTFLGTVLRSNLAFPLLAVPTEFEACIRFNKPIRASGGVVPGFFVYQDTTKVINGKEKYGLEKNEIDFEFLHKDYSGNPGVPKPAYMPKGAVWINTWRNGSDFNARYGDHTQPIGVWDPIRKLVTGWDPLQWNNYVIRRNTNSVEWLRRSPTGQLVHIFTADDQGYSVPDPSKALEVILNIWHPNVSGDWQEATDPNFYPSSVDGVPFSYDVQWVEVRGSHGKRVRGKK